jgi:hypothetical protein
MELELGALCFVLGALVLCTWCLVLGALYLELCTWCLVLRGALQRTKHEEQSTKYKAQKYKAQTSISAEAAVTRFARVERLVHPTRSRVDQPLRLRFLRRRLECHRLESPRRKPSRDIQGFQHRRARLLIRQ